MSFWKSTKQANMLSLLHTLSLSFSFSLSHTNQHTRLTHARFLLHKRHTRGYGGDTGHTHTHTHTHTKKHTHPHKETHTHTLLYLTYVFAIFIGVCSKESSISQRPA